MGANEFLSLEGRDREVKRVQRRLNLGCCGVADCVKAESTPEQDMPDEFQYDVFLSHSAKDKAVVRDVAERLRKDGVKVWFDEWVLKPGGSIPAKIEEGL